MRKTFNTPFSQFENLHKDNHFQVQMEVVFQAFQSPSTMLMIAHETGIERANICRYVATWEKQGLIHFVGLGVCTISKHRAGFYNTDKIS